MKKGLIFLLCLSPVFLVGCTNFGKSLVDAFFPKDQTVSNRCRIWSEGFDGIDTHPNTTTKILLTHGIGTKQPGHSTNLMIALAERMGFNGMNRFFKEIQLTNSEKEDLGTLRVYRFTKENRQLLFYEQTWSSITEPLKSQLARDTTGEYALKRAHYNQLGKQYFNNRIADPVAYLGPTGKQLLESTAQAFCWMASVDYADLKNTDTAICPSNSKKILENLATENIAFITHSLGSRMVIDTFQKIISEAPNPVEKTAQNHLNQLKQKEIPVFMMSNQLPLIQLGKDSFQQTGTFNDYCQKTGKKYNQRILKTLNLVAFSDPNDLLSYSLDPARADDYLNERLCPIISNISIETTDAVDVIGTGSFVNPMAAHTTYSTDDRILDIIINGLSDAHPAPENCQWIHLEEKI